MFFASSVYLKRSEFTHLLAHLAQHYDTKYAGLSILNNFWVSFFHRNETLQYRSQYRSPYRILFDLFLTLPTQAWFFSNSTPSSTVFSLLLNMSRLIHFLDIKTKQQNASMVSLKLLFLWQKILFPYYFPNKIFTVLAGMMRMRSIANLCVWPFLDWVKPFYIFTLCLNARKLDHVISATINHANKQEKLVEHQNLVAWRSHKR